MRQRARSRGTDSCDDWIVSQSHLTDSPASLPGKVKVSTNFWYIVQYHIVPCVDELLLCLHPFKNLLSNSMAQFIDGLGANA